MALEPILLLREQMRRMELAAQKRPEAAEKIRWQGSAVDFADWIYEAWRAGKIAADTETAAFELASQHFCQRDGRPFKKRSLQVSRNARKELKG